MRCCIFGSITVLYWYPSVTESAALPPYSRRSIMTIPRPLCPKCQKTTTLARVTPGTSGFDIRTFECPACDLIHQFVVELERFPIRLTIS